MNRTLTLICLITLVGCASSGPLPAIVSPQPPDMTFYRWMHIEATSVANHFRLCDTSCPLRTPKTLAIGAGFSRSVPEQIGGNP